MVVMSIYLQIYPICCSNNCAVKPMPTVNNNAIPQTMVIIGVDAAELFVSLAERSKGVKSLLKQYYLNYALFHAKT